MSGRVCRAGVVAALLAAAGAGAATTSDHPAAILVYPEVRITEDLDTHIQLTNAAAELIDVRCFYELTEMDCVGGQDGESCDVEPVTCSGACAEQHRRLPFHVRLTSHQPLAWRASLGLADAPLDGVERTGPDGQSNRTTYVPPLGDGPVAGVLRCAVVDGATLAPRPLDALVGQATVAGSTAGDGDGALYRAIGAPALGAGDGDDVLSLGGSPAEYAGCQTANVLEHFFSGGPLTTGAITAEVATDLVLTTCGSTAEEPTRTVVQFLVYNEFGQRFSTSRQVAGRLARPLAAIDTSEPARSIFSVNVAGTLGGRTEVASYGGGMHALAFERHRDRATNRVTTAAIDVHRAGERVSGDRLVLPPPPCAGDCDGDGDVSIDELITSVGIAIGQAAVDGCRGADHDGDGLIGIHELVASVSASLAGCPTALILPTPTPSPSPPPTENPTPAGAGPQITLLGLASADDRPLQPDGVDDQGRPVYVRPHGQGFTLLVEARQGTARRPVGQSSYRPEGEPDLQLLVSRPLGDGDAAVCEDDGARGGVPAVPELVFASDPATVAAMNDLGCRAYDRASAVRPCTRVAAADDELFAFVGRPGTSVAQFCVPVARAWAFPTGDTVVAARLRDAQGNFGNTREMVVRVEE